MWCLLTWQLQSGHRTHCALHARVQCWILYRCHFQLLFCKVCCLLICVTHFRIHHHIGEFLALTGFRLDAVDCLFCGLADFYVPSNALPALMQALQTYHFTNATSSKQQMQNLLHSFSTIPSSQPVLVQYQEIIDKCFRANSVSSILQKYVELIFLTLARLEAESVHQEWCQTMAKTIRASSPTGLAISLRMVRMARSMSIDECVYWNYIVSCCCFHYSRDFIEV